MKLLLYESVGEDVNCLHKTGTILEIDDPIINQFSNVVNVDFNMFSLLTIHWIYEKLQYTMIVTKYDSQTMDNDMKLRKEMLQSNGLNGGIEHSFILDLY